MAQLVERVVRDDETGGSSPPTPTNQDFLKIWKRLFARSAPQGRGYARIFPYISGLNQKVGGNQNGFFCRDIVNWKSILKNQLHALLHQCFGDHYKDGYSKTFGKKACITYTKELKRRVKKDPNDFLAQSTVRKIERLILLTEQLVIIDKKIENISKDVPDVKRLSGNIHGCGVSTAATIVSQVYTIKRFSTKAKFAKYAGIAPTEKSSGQRGRLYTSPFGNRILNKAIHRIALSQISGNGDERGKIYYRKKLSEGKTKLWSLRCLKRQLSNRVYHVLKHAD